MTARYFVLPAAVAATLMAVSPSVGAALLMARVPFSFTVMGEAFLPGRCTVSTGGSNLQGVALVQGAAGGALALVNPLKSAKEVEPKLVFHKYGDEYVLREVWLGSGRGLRLSESAVERKLREDARSRNVVLAFERVSVPGL
jgi:hypothetical protein